jgi:hypothetical protein
MLEDESDWVDLYKKEIFSTELMVDPFHILLFGLDVNFVVGANMNVSVGCNFLYQQLKRYIFTIYVFAETATSDTLDLKPEEYEFTFYIMGTLGLRADISVEIKVSLLSLALASVGIEDNHIRYSLSRLLSPYPLHFLLDYLYPQERSHTIGMIQIMLHPIRCRPVCLPLCRTGYIRRRHSGRDSGRPACQVIAFSREFGRTDRFTELRLAGSAFRTVVGVKGQRIAVQGIVQPEYEIAVRCNYT